MTLGTFKPDNHVLESLPAYINGTLDAHQSKHVHAHLTSCAQCQQAYVSWQAIQSGMRTANASMSPPPVAFLDRVWAEIDAAEHSQSAMQDARISWPTTVRRSAIHLGQTLSRQIPLMPQGIWAASLAALTFAFLCVLLWQDTSAAPFLLGIILAPVAAAGVAFIHGPEHDPCLELTLATPTSLRLVLFSRFLLVMGYNIVLALGATVLAMLIHGGSFWLLASSWLGPMLLLAALCLLVSVTTNTVVGVACVALLWCLRFLVSALTFPGNNTIAPGGTALAPFTAIWQTNPVILALAVALLLAAMLTAPRRALPLHTLVS